MKLEGRPRWAAFAMILLGAIGATTAMTSAALAQAAPSAEAEEEPAEASGAAPGDGDPLTTPDGEAPNASEEETAEDEKSELEQRVQELEDIVQELERKASVQRLGWSADYRVTLSSFRYEGDSLDGARNADGSRKQVSLKNTEQWTHRVRLAIQADPSPKLRFRARLVAFKRFGDTSFTPLVDGAQGRVPRDASARFDRFWLDWFVTDKLSFSLGRISTTDGSPAELRENLERPAATVSLGFVDSEYDAIAMTYQLGPLLFRASYLSWQFQNPDDTFGLLPFLAKDSIPVRIYGASLLVRSENHLVPSAELSAYVNPEFRSVYPIAGLPGPDGTPIKPSYTPRSFGAMSAGTLLLLWRDLFPGFDFFASGSVSFADPNGKAIEYPLGPNGENVPVLALVSSDSDDHLGYHAYGGLRYTLPVGGEHAPKLGFETTYGSRYVVTFTTPTSDLVTRIGVRGHTYDVYAIQPIYGNLFARLSYTLIDYNYAPPVGGGLGFVEAYGGSAPESDRRIQGVNLMLHASF
jgi:Protein of unknown function (DUF3373)